MKQQKIIIAVSSCLMGDPVRYDGKDKANQTVISVLSQEFDVIHICPETGIGMSVPRPAIQLVEKPDDSIHACGVEKKSQDVTDALLSYVNELDKRLSSISGYIFKARSPSCGVGSTPVFSDSGEQIKLGNGVFAQAVMNKYPDLPIAEESEIENRSACNGFLENVRAYHARHFIQAE
ncbi:MAG: DUF523 domain-containing protein [Gammaproteobacteria bacterium]|nr:DUF523 domain-containing protein [Gammaproteobacteria bacterium]